MTSLSDTAVKNSPTMDSDDREGDGTLSEVLALFELYWFRRLILLPLPPSPSPAAPPPLPVVEDTESRTSSPPPPANILARRRLRHRRSVSDDLNPLPTLRIQPPRLRTILSGKESAPEGSGGDESPSFAIAVEELDERRRKRRIDSWRRRRRRRAEASKSLSELEFEELKGFMDLGFTFSDVEADPRLMEIVPGLQRMRAAPAADQDAASSSSASAEEAVPTVARPYLSEAWDAEEASKLGEIKIPIGGGADGVDLKDQLRFWAHAVASAVR